MTFSYSPARFEASFWERVTKTDTCWIWIGAINRAGYGQVYVPRFRNIRMAHRVAWELTYGEREDGAIGCHSCDNPPCVNPDHITWATHSENMADRHQKGRDAKGQTHWIVKSPHLIKRGEASKMSKITQNDAEAMRELSAQGWTGRAIAAHYNLGRSTVSRILRGTTWVRPQG